MGGDKYGTGAGFTTMSGSNASIRRHERSRGRVDVEIGFSDDIGWQGVSGGEDNIVERESEIMANADVTSGDSPSRATGLTAIRQLAASSLSYSSSYLSEAESSSGGDNTRNTHEAMASALSKATHGLLLQIGKWHASA
ncbi:hypothetical protein EDB85DRAFT_1892953, partial [Lactarius pseudohatsudake]